MAEAAQAAVAGLTRDLDFLRLAEEPFARAPIKSIDYAVMERTKLAAVLPADFGWSDVGSWSSVWTCSITTPSGNATDGPVVVMDSRNSLVRSEEPILTAVIGLDDVIVVSTADAVLVASRAKAEQVKGLVDELKLRNHRAAVEHRRIHRPWGYYQDVDIAARYRVKRIVVKSGSTLSLQKALPSIGALGRREGHRRGLHSTTPCAPCTKTSRSISRSAAFIGSPIRAKSRSS